MTQLDDEARRVLFAEVQALAVARAHAATLSKAMRRILYAEIETLLARENEGSAIAESVKPDPSSIACSVEMPVAVDADPLVTGDVPERLPSAAEPELSYAEAKRASKHGYLSRLLERANGNQSLAARMAGVDRSNFRKLLIRFGLLLKSAEPMPASIEHTEKYTDTILKILAGNPQGLRTYEIAQRTEQEIDCAFGILRLLQRQGRIERHGQRTNTLWTLPGGLPKPRIETIPAAAIEVLSRADGPLDGRRLRDEMITLLLENNVGKPPSPAALRRGINRLIEIGQLEHCGANERGALVGLAKGDASDLN